MWIRYRKWKHVFFWPLAVLAWLYLQSSERSAAWSVGLAIGLFLGLAYLVEEVVWMTKRKGRPCPRCGQHVPVASFRLQAKCPNCGL